MPRLVIVEDWVQIASALSLNGGTEKNSSPFAMDGGSPIAEPCDGLEWKLVVNDADTDDVEVRLYGCPSGVATAVDSVANQGWTEECGGTDPYRRSGVLDFGELGSGGRFSFKRTGSEDGITVDFWIRRFRWIR